MLALDSGELVAVVPAQIYAVPPAGRYSSLEQYFWKVSTGQMLGNREGHF